MGYPFFILGLLLCLSGLVAMFAGINLCQQIVQATSDRRDGITVAETWLNIYQGQKRRKLRALIDHDPDPELVAAARRVLFLDKLMYALFLPGMVLIMVS